VPKAGVSEDSQHTSGGFEGRAGGRTKGIWLKQAGGVSWLRPDRKKDPSSRFGMLKTLCKKGRLRGAAGKSHPSDPCTTLTRLTACFANQKRDDFLAKERKTLRAAPGGGEEFARHQTFCVLTVKKKLMEKDGPELKMLGPLCWCRPRSFL